MCHHQVSIQDTHAWPDDKYLGLKLGVS